MPKNNGFFDDNPSEEDGVKKGLLQGLLEGIVSFVTDTVTDIADNFIENAVNVGTSVFEKGLQVIESNVLDLEANPVDPLQPGLPTLSTGFALDPIEAPGPSDRTVSFFGHFLEMAQNASGPYESAADRLSIVTLEAIQRKDNPIRLQPGESHTDVQLAKQLTPQELAELIEEKKKARKDALAGTVQDQGAKAAELAAAALRDQLAKERIGSRIRAEWTSRAQLEAFGSSIFAAAAGVGDAAASILSTAASATQAAGALLGGSTTTSRGRGAGAK